MLAGGCLLHLPAEASRIPATQKDFYRRSTVFSGSFRSEKIFGNIFIVCRAIVVQSAVVLEYSSTMVLQITEFCACVWRVE